jgi:hypothetical protein
MAIFRKIHTSFWSDPFIQDLDNDHKLFYLYLLTNEKTKQCGIYEISKKQISFELGYSIDRVSKLLTYFIKTGKILYSEETKEIAIKNWNKFNGSTSPKVVSCIVSELKNVKDRVLIEYVNGMYTASQEEQEQEEEEEQQPEEQINEIFNELWNLYDKKVSKESSLKAFKNVSKNAYDEIRKNIPLFVKQYSDKQFQPHFSTYLNGKRWKDELKAEVKPFVINQYRKATLDDD